jgi:hypothetical protein
MSRPLQPHEQAALTALTLAVANVMDLGAAGVENLAEHVQENGTDHEKGQPIDNAVVDALTVIADQL